MGDTRGGSGPDIVETSRGAPVVGQSSMDDLIGTLTMFMQQQRISISGQGATKALKGVVDKIRRFDGKDIIRYLKVYICEMEVHQVLGNTMMETFGLAVVPEIRNRVHEIRGLITPWARFEERLRMSTLMRTLRG
jgi:hypothetical protein